MRGLLAYPLLLCVGKLTLAAPIESPKCPDYSHYSRQKHEPYSSGVHQLPFQRPSAECRTFVSQDVEDTIARMQSIIKDPDLYRLFENTFPNTLDTAIKWRGYAWADEEERSTFTEEELTFIITGDIDAMWLRDSANQVLSYLPILTASDSPDSLASLFRGVINLHSRYIKIAPYCHAFQPPLEAQSEISPQVNGAYFRNKLEHAYNRTTVFDCKWELDSLASFLQLSSSYYNATLDLSPFTKYKWMDTVEVLLSAAAGMRRGSYLADGHVDFPPYTFVGQTDRSTETTANNGLGNPVNLGTGLVRSTFRPSDDGTIFQLLIPSNMMFAAHLSSCALIMDAIGTQRASSLGVQMRDMAAGIYADIERLAIIDLPKYGKVYAFEVDGYSSHNMMDDANIPGLLSAPLFGYGSISDEIYQNTRRFVLSEDNPYWSWGPVISGIGGAHCGLGKAWPLALIVRILTSRDAAEIRGQLKQLLGTTGGLGLIHESVNGWGEHDWSRQWFSWANGMFGQMIIEMRMRSAFKLATIPQILVPNVANGDTGMNDTFVPGFSSDGADTRTTSREQGTVILGTMNLGHHEPWTP
ncbi:MAG: glycoside hydrolase family 125 [Lasallia pustulata]|uniref:Glycoside hydrolase family 125 n=1 Tax=Lasallia pustulata TaxID=136370 RepID=A0A5M8PN38_9LECA|nr:MAG: glycoside hydrolase family 125 [Lasallia pustulata]